MHYIHRLPVEEKRTWLCDKYVWMCGLVFGSYRIRLDSIDLEWGCENGFFIQVFGHCICKYNSMSWCGWKVGKNKFGWSNSPDSVDWIGQRFSAVVPVDSFAVLGIGLTFLFWFWDNSRVSQFISFAFLKVLGFIFWYFN